MTGRYGWARGCWASKDREFLACQCPVGVCVVPVVIGTKADVRREIRLRFRGERENAMAHSAAICARVVQDPAWGTARTVGIFASHGGEPLVDGLWESAGNRTLCYPRIRGNDLDFFAVNGPMELEKSVFGLREPRGDSGYVDLECLDLVLVPGMAFTRAGVRLGRGGGFYDRFLARPGLRAFRFGVCFEFQIWSELPEESHDERVDRVVTERG